MVCTINMSYLDLMVKNREITIDRYFKWWISTKLVWTMY
jgi:hypothetical protein